MIANSPAFRSEKTPWRVRYEVCDGHVARQDERDRTSEQAEHDQHTADELNHAVDAGERRGGHSRHRRNWQAQIFRRPVLQEQQTNDDTQNTQRTGGPRCEKAVDRRLNISPVNALRLTLLTSITVSRPST